MGRTPCCDKMGVKKGPWSPEEDRRLVNYILNHGFGNWRALPKQAGLLRCGKSCRLRWTNYLRPDLKRGNLSPEEEATVIALHEVLGNKWSTIASHLPGRTDNEIKNIWNTHIKKRLASASPSRRSELLKNNPLNVSTSAIWLPSSSSSSTSVTARDSSDSANTSRRYGNAESTERCRNVAELCDGSTEFHSDKFSADLAATKELKNAEERGHSQARGNAGYGESSEISGASIMTQNDEIGLELDDGGSGTFLLDTENGEEFSIACNDLDMDAAFLTPPVSDFSFDAFLSEANEDVFSPLWILDE